MGTADVYRFATSVEQKLGMEVTLFEFDVIDDPRNTSLRFPGLHRGLAALVHLLATGLHWRASGLHPSTSALSTFHPPLIHPQGSNIF